MKVCDKTCIFCFFPIINKYLCMAKRSLLSICPSYISQPTNPTSHFSFQGQLMCELLLCPQHYTYNGNQKGEVWYEHKEKITRSFETSVSLRQSGRCSIPEDWNLQQHHRENPKYRTFGFSGASQSCPPLCRYLAKLRGGLCCGVVARSEK